MSDTGDAICKQLNDLRAKRRPLDEILTAAVERVHESNPLFHWTGIYELFPDNILRLGPFIGAPTNHVFICVGQGVCGTAVAQKRNINVPDVTKATNYLACSQETKSELVVLIRSGSRIYGQIDIDSHEFAAFDDDAETLVEKVADGLALAYDDQQTRRLEPTSARDTKAD
jgi:L-methionine (R)-S-oxide reductase